MGDLILVTDWEKVDKKDFYLSKDWEREAGKDNLKIAKKLQKEGKLYYGYTVDSTSYAIFGQMDANQFLINDDCDVIIPCESAIISNNHKHRIKYED